MTVDHIAVAFFSVGLHFLGHDEHAGFVIGGYGLMLLLVKFFNWILDQGI